MSIIINPYRFASAAPGTSYWNPADKGSLIVLSGANSQTATNSSGVLAWNSVRGITSRNSGLWYAEEEMLINNAGFNIFGVATSAASLASFGGADAFAWTIQNDGSSNVRNNGANTPTGLTPPGAGERNMVFYNATTGQIWLGTRGNWVSGGNPSAGTGATFTIAPGTTLYLIGSKGNNTQSATLRNQVGENAHPIPTGGSMWG